MAPIIWRLEALDIPLLPKDGKVIEDYGNRIFRNPGFCAASRRRKNLRETSA